MICSQFSNFHIGTTVRLMHYLWRRFWKNALLVTRNEILEAALCESAIHIERLHTQNTNSALVRLALLIQKQIKAKNLLLTKSFITVSIPWITGFELNMRSIEGGCISQPLPYYWSNSNVTIRDYKTNQD